MIQNKAQYEITKAQVKKFELALMELGKFLKRNPYLPLLRAERDGIKSQLKDLKIEIKE